MSVFDRPSRIQGLSMGDPSFVRRSLTFLGFTPNPNKKADRPSLLESAERMFMAAELHAFAVLRLPAGGGPRDQVPVPVAA